jgi:hypothetical protein
VDLSRLAPADASAALRSYGRRYRQLLAPIADDDDVEELAHRVGPEGRSAIEITSDVTRTLVLLHEAERQITVHDTPVLHPAVLDRTQRRWDTTPPERLDDVLDLLADTTSSFADDVDRVSADAWNRAGTIAGGGAVTALDVVREAVQVGRDGLDAVTRTLAAVRR